MVHRALCILLMLFASASTSSVVVGAEADLLPMPKKVAWLDGHVRLAGAGEARACFITGAPRSAAVRTGIAQVNERVVALGGRKLPVRAAGEADSDVRIWVGTHADLAGLRTLLRDEPSVPEEMRVPDGYVLRCVKAGERDDVVCIGHDERGCYYGLQTLAQLLGADDGGVSLPRVDIVDWPTYRIRLVKNSATKDDPATIERFAGLLPRYKLNVYALQYHAEQNGTWREPSERYQQVIETVGALAGRDGVLEPALFVCPFFRPRIDLTKQADVELYTDRLRWGVRQGYQWIEVDFNDWAQWQHVTAAEKARFADIGQYWAHLTNSVYEAIRPEFPDVGIIVCATSPWYRGQARPELVTLCRAIPEDVLTYWTGPVTRSRRISAGQVEDWTRATGRKPLLWDNTIYAHFQPYWVGYAFNPFFNTFPPNLPELLAGPGMHLNATAAPHYVPGIMTYADYLWNPEGYDPGRSIRTALRLCWGEEAPDAAQEVQERLVGLYRMLYECGKGWEPYDRAHADAMLSELQEAVTRLADIAGDPALAADMDERFVSAARAAVEQFKPPEKLAPRPEPIARPLSAGAVNPSVEEVVDGKPVGWSLYHGAGVARMSLSPDANSGERSLCIEATRWYQDPTHPTHGDRKWINVALVHGSELGGKEGRDAYDVEPSTSYRCSFYLKGDVPTVHLQYQGWSFMMDSNARESLRGDLEEIRPTGEWQRYTSTFDTDYATKKFALKFALIGYEDEGMRLGSIWVDDVSIEALE